MTVDLKLHRAIVLSRSAAARLEQLAARVPADSTGSLLRQAARVLDTAAQQLEQRLHELLDAEPSYLLAERKERQ